MSLLSCCATHQTQWYVLQGGRTATIYVPVSQRSALSET